MVKSPILRPAPYKNTEEFVMTDIACWPESEAGVVHAILLCMTGGLESPAELAVEFQRGFPNYFDVYCMREDLVLVESTAKWTRSNPVASASNRCMASALPKRCQPFRFRMHERSLEYCPPHSSGRAIRCDYESLPSRVGALAVCMLKPQFLDDFALQIQDQHTRDPRIVIDCHPRDKVRFLNGLIYPFHHQQHSCKAAVAALLGVAPHLLKVEVVTQKKPNA
ncbi:MAG: hypothetical protein ABIG66_03220 [Candidatus Kerfeldbacteria bacterium]